MNLEEYYDDIYRYCFFRMQDRSLAEDLTQETFLKFLETSTYHDRGKPLAFLYTIARNLCIDHIRRTKTRPESGINCDTSISSNAAHSTEGAAFSPTASVSELTDTSIVLAQALQTLSESDREIICLRYVLELNPGEIGRIMTAACILLPYLLTCALTLPAVRKLRGRDCTILCAGISALVSIFFLTADTTGFLDRAADIPALIPAALLFFGIAAVLELRKYIRQSEELTWNFTLTG